MFEITIPRLGLMTRPLEDFFDTWGELPVYDAACEEWVPPSNITETDKHFVVTMEVPGIDMAKTDVTFRDRLLIVKGEKAIETETDECCVRAERFTGAFERDFMLAGVVDVDKIDATYKDGILRIVLPKSESSLPKKIAIH